MKDTREKLLKTAAKLFAQKGYTGTSVRDIVQRAGANLSAVQYYFGGKNGLYLATVAYLTGQIRAEMMKEMVLPQEISALSREQALDSLKQMINRFLDMSFSRKNILLERIFTYAELEDSRTFRETLLNQTSRFRDTWYGLVSHLTGLKVGSAELILLCHTIFSQGHQSDFMRFAVCHQLKLKKYTPQLCDQIKELVWNNTRAILDLYNKEKK